MVGHAVYQLGVLFDKVGDLSNSKVDVKYNYFCVHLICLREDYPVDCVQQTSLLAGRGIM